MHFTPSNMRANNSSLRHAKKQPSARCSVSSSSNGNGSTYLPIGFSGTPTAEAAAIRHKDASNGSSHSTTAAATSKTATVILTEQQAEMARKGDVLYDAVKDVADTATDTLTAPGQVFVCPEESLFYSQCIEKMVFSRPDCPKTLIEFGAGCGSPVISALLKSAPCPDRVINAYEISPRAAHLAGKKAVSYGLGQTYVVHNGCFWRGMEQTPSECLIANPPYLPAPDDRIMMPGLWGGVDGAGLTRDLLPAGFDSAMMMMSAYSNPVLTLQHAQQQGYAVTDFLVTPLPFGTYSSEPKVKSWIEEMKERGEAFYTHQMYFLAGVLFEKQPENKPDLTPELLNVLTAF